MSRRKPITYDQKRRAARRKQKVQQISLLPVTMLAALFFWINAVIWLA